MKIEASVRVEDGALIREYRVVTDDAGGGISLVSNVRDALIAIIRVCEAPDA